MEFLKRMKKREFIEMGLKTAIGVLLGIIVIFLMEAMICNIYMDAINGVESYASTPDESVYYVIDNKDDTYDIYINYQPDEADTWARVSDNLSKEAYEKLWQDGGNLKEAKKVIYRAPNCFDIYINGIHYAVMIVFILAIGGVYAWRFTLISKEYKKLERKFNKTGKVFI